MDTAGSDTPVKNEALECKRATDALLRELILHLCSFIIVVVNSLRASDQIYIKQILNFRRSTNTRVGIIVVHNLLEVSKVCDVEIIIKDETKSIFGATEDEMQISVDGHDRSIKFFKSKQDGIDLHHFILAQTRSEAAEKWNVQSLDGIMNIFQTSSEYKHRLDIINDMINFINAKLPQLLVRRGDDPDNSSDHQNLQIVQHDNQPYIVLSDRKELEDLEEDPCDKLELAKRIIYDDSGYFIRGESGLWQPRHNLYGGHDQIYVIIELPGFGEGKCDFIVSETSIIVEGTRDDLKISPNDVALHQSEIPSGSFKLQIPLTCAVDADNVKVSRHDGLVTAIVPKKKIPVKRVNV